MKRICPVLLGLLLLLLTLGGCGDNSQPTRTIDFLPLRSIVITSQNPQAALGTSNRFTAIGHYGDPSTFQFTRDITSQVTWSSSDPAVLAFNDPALAGFATTAQAGSATVSATLDGIQGQSPFTVSSAIITSVSITAPASTTLYAGNTLQLQATGTFSDGSSQDLTDSATWSSNDPSVATVGSTMPGRGLVKGVAQGSTDITASFEAQGTTKTATQTLDVAAASLQSIAVTAEQSRTTLARGTSLQLTATGTYSDGSTQDLTSQVTWASSSTAIAVVDQDPTTHGLLSALGTGTSTVTATLQGVVSPGLDITVSSATLSSLSLSPTSPTVAVGKNLQLTATGTFSDGSSQDVTRDVVWSSANTNLASISDSIGSQGLAKGLATGTVTLSAGSNTIPTTSGGTVNASVVLTVQ